MHSTSTFPVEHLANYDRRYVINFEGRQSGDGFIKVFRHNEDSTRTMDTDNLSLGVHRELVEQLVNRFFSIHAPLFPVLSRADFIASSPLDPLLLYVICGISSLSKDVPRDVLRTFKSHIAGLFRRDDFGANSNLQTIQALLLYVWTLELEPTFGGSKSWNTLGMVSNLRSFVLR
jgi:Fungal specific transcription factor domain